MNIRLNATTYSEKDKSTPLTKAVLEAAKAAIEANRQVQYQWRMRWGIRLSGERYLTVALGGLL